MTGEVLKIQFRSGFCLSFRNFLPRLQREKVRFKITTSTLLRLNKVEEVNRSISTPRDVNAQLRV